LFDHLEASLIEAVSSPTLPNETVLAALDELLNDPGFKTSARNKRFLRFVVEETLAGRASRIKSYTIAVDVFGRSAEFDGRSIQSSGSRQAACALLWRVTIITPRPARESKLLSLRVATFPSSGTLDSIQVRLPLLAALMPVRAKPVCHIFRVLLKNRHPSLSGR
jgi:hypothetical protein